MTTETLKKLAQTLLTGGTDTLYTVPGGTTALVKTIFVVNTDGASTESVKIWQSGSGAANVILPAVDLGPGEFGTFDGAITMAAADTIKALGGTHVAVTIEGVEFS